MVADLSNTELLHQLAAAAEGERATLLRARGDPAGVVAALADDVERLAITDLAQALRAADALVAGADDAPAPPSSRARARRASAQALAYANRFPEALARLAEGTQLADDAGDRVEAARSRLTTLHALARMGRYEEALGVGERAREAFVRAGEPVLAARADINLGVTRRMSGDPAGAVAHFDRARPAVLAQPVLLAQLESNRAEALLDLGRFSDAEKAFRAALDEFERAGLARACGIVEGNLGDLTARQGRLREALMYFERARRRLGETDAPGDAARLDAELAEALAAVGYTDQAIDTYARCILPLAEHKLAWEHARALVGQGRLLSRAGRLAEADDALARAADAFRSLKHDAGVGVVRSQQALLALRAGRGADAESLVREGLSLLSERPAELAAARLHLGSVLLELGRAAETATAAREALATATALGLPALRGDALHLLGRAQSVAGDLDAAIQSLRASIAEAEHTRATLPGDRARAAFLGGRSAVYAHSIGAVLDRAAPAAADDALDLSERAGARSLLDLLDTEPPPDDASNADESLAEARRLRHELNALYDRIYDDPTRPGRSAPPADWRKVAREHEARLALLERRAASISDDADPAAATISAADLRRVLPAGTGLLAFVPDGRAYSLLAVDHAGGDVLRRVAGVDQIVELTSALQFQLSRALARGAAGGPMPPRLADDCRRELRRLAESLLARAEPFIRSHPRLAIVPHGSLHALPFHALVASLIPETDLALSQVPSASVLARLRQRAAAAPTPSSGALVVGVADTRAPAAEDEARACAALLPGSTLLTGPDATVPRVAEMLGHAGVVHVASHARFVASEPRASGVRLADGWLTTHEISRLRMPGSTVILSGCDTGRARLDSGHEFLGLVRAFLQAGTGELLVSLWPVQDLFALHFMKTLYTVWGRGGSAGGSVGRALAEAQRQARASGVHPLFWAPFIRMGDL